ncbi:MAG: hypothetical protein ACXAEU_16705 [Candidatus Hodarchaeales archaeon]|jgi:hypothetical protein
MRKRILLSPMTVILLLSLISTNSSSAFMGWAVKEGDSMTYIISSFYQYGLDDPTEGFVKVKDQTGARQYVPIKKGTEMKYEITNLTYTYEYGPNWSFSYKITYITDNSQITTEELTAQDSERDHGQVIPTFPNKTLWEQHARDYYPDRTNCSMTVEDNLIIVQRENQDSNRSLVTEHPNGTLDFHYLTNTTILYEYKRNWESGWIIYHLYKLFNSTQTFIEYEYTQKTSGLSFSPGFEFLSVILAIQILVVLTKKYKRAADKDSHQK